MRFWPFKEKRATSTSSGHPRDPALVKWLFGDMANTSAGVNVTPDTAKALMAVGNCVRVLSEDVGTIPLILYKRLKDGGKERAAAHSVYKLLHRKPNNTQTSADFRRMMLGHYLLRGNAYAEKIFLNSGKVEQLIPLHPDRVRPFATPGGGKAYEHTPINGKRRIILQHEMHHFADISSDGIKGDSRITQAKEALGFSMATNEYGARIFSNGAVPGALLRHPGNLSEEASKRLIKSWEERHQGVDKSSRPALLEEGMDYKQIGITPGDAQFLESKKFSRSEICGMFRVPPDKIGDLERSTFNNIESQSIQYVVGAIRPIAVAWEQALVRDLLTEREQEELYAEFLLEGLLRGDIKSHYEAYAIARQNGWMSGNDIRKRENMDPIKEGGDIYLVPLNMVPADQVGNPIESIDVPPKEDKRSLENSSVKSNEERSVKEISRVKKSFRGIFEDAAGRIVRHEVKAVQKAVKKYISQRSVVEFDLWLDEFYRDFDDTVSKNMLPSLTTFAASIYAVSAGEIGLTDTTVTPDITRFINSYVSNMAKRHTSSSLGQIRKIISEHSGSDVDVALSTRLDEWNQKRPLKMAFRETVQAAAAIQKATYKAGGIRKLKWVTVGENCPLCKSLNGRIVGIESAFANEGDEINADGANPITVKRTMGHPPLHQGCDCQIVAA